MTLLINETTRAHFDKYAALAKKKGVGFKSEFFNQYMGKTPAQWTELYKQDKHLNNVPLAMFDAYYGFTGKGISLAENCGMHKHVIIYQVIGAIPEFVED